MIPLPLPPEIILVTTVITGVSARGARALIKLLPVGVPHPVHRS